MYIWHVFLIYFVVLFKISSALFQGEFVKIRLLSSIYQRPIGDWHALLETYMLHRTPTCLIRHWSKTNMLNQVFPISIQWSMSVANEACQSPIGFQSGMSVFFKAYQFQTYPYYPGWKNRHCDPPPPPSQFRVYGEQFLKQNKHIAEIIQPRTQDEL